MHIAAPRIGVVGILLVLLVPAAMVTAQPAEESQPPPVESFRFDVTPSGADPQADGDDRTLWDALGENMRVNVDVISRIGFTRRRSEPEFLNALGLDIHTVVSDSEGDIGTLLLQPYLVRRDNFFERTVTIDGNDAFIIELHDFYFNLTRWGRGRTNFKIGHFDVPFGLEPRTDTHFTLRRLIPLHDVGFKKDWGVSINGSPPAFDYEVSLTRGTGMDLTDLGRDPYLVAGRIGTPSEENRVMGLSAFYGEVIDNHGGHRVDEGDPRGDVREPDGFVRRLRVGVDFSQIMGQFELKGELSGGRDFEQEVFNSILEVNWTSADGKLTAYLQGVYLGQDGHLGWDADARTRAGVLWGINSKWSVSAEWTHELYRYFQEVGGTHVPDDLFSFQIRMLF